MVPSTFYQCHGFEVRLKDGKASGAVDKYEEGLYIIDKCREVRGLEITTLREGFVVNN